MAETVFLDPETRVVRTASALSAEVDDELVLMHVDRGVYVGLDDVGCDIWRRIEHPVSFGALCAALAGAWRAEPGAIERDTAQLLERLQQEGLVEILT